MKIYLKKFDFPSSDAEWQEIVFGSKEFKRTCYNSIYPFKVLPEHIRKLEFSPITVLYGTNGSGKTTTMKMLATLLLPAGITNEACIYYKNEYKILGASDDPERAYVEDVLPGKMYYNLKSIQSFGFWHEVKVLFMTVLTVLGKDYQGDYVAPEKKDGEPTEEKEAIHS